MGGRERCDWVGVMERCDLGGKVRERIYVIWVGVRERV